MDHRWTITKTWDGRPVEQEAQVELRMRLNPDGDATIWIDAPYHNDPAPSAPPGSLWGLWEFEVVEVFIVGDGGRYLEAEFGPHGCTKAGGVWPARSLARRRRSRRKP